MPVLAQQMAEEVLNEIFPPLEPVERDESFDRDYIPMPGGFEVQTKGKGSSFRIADTEGDDRMAFGPTSFERDFLTNMAYKIREAYGV